MLVMKDHYLGAVGRIRPGVSQGANRKQLSIYPKNNFKFYLFFSITFFLSKNKTGNRS